MRNTILIKINGYLCQRWKTENVLLDVQHLIISKFVIYRFIMKIGGYDGFNRLYIIE